MKDIKQANNRSPLAESLEALHKESKGWSSEIELWKIELKFFQKLLHSHAHNMISIKDKKRISHFQNLITHYSSEVLEQFEQKIRQHEKYLAKELTNKKRLDVSGYRKKHAEIASHMGAFSIEFAMYKRKFFDFIENST